MFDFFKSRSRLADPVNTVETAIDHVAKAKAIASKRFVRLQQEPPGRLKDVTERMADHFGVSKLAEKANARVFKSSADEHFFLKTNRNIWFKVVDKSEVAEAPKTDRPKIAVPDGLDKQQKRDFIVKTLQGLLAQRGIHPAEGQEQAAVAALRDIEKKEGILNSIRQLMTDAIIGKKDHDGLPTTLNAVEKAVIEARSYRGARSILTELEMQDPLKYPLWNKLGSSIRNAVEGWGFERINVDSPEFMRRLSGLVQSPVTLNNTIEVIADNASEVSLHRKLILDPSVRSIHMSNWKIHNDASGKQFLALLAEKKRLQPDTDIQVIVDGNVAHSDLELEGLLKTFSAQNQIPVTFWADGGLGMHEKKIVLNGDSAEPEVLVSDRNLGDDYLSADPSIGWLGTAVLISGPAARVAENNFRRLNNRAAEIPPREGDVAPKHMALLEGDPNMMAPGSGTETVVEFSDIPGPTNPQNFAKAMTAAIASAKAGRDIIRIDQGYLMDIPGVGMELMRAAGRGVEIELLTNSKGSNDVSTLVGPSLVFVNKLDRFKNVKARTRYDATNPDRKLTTDHRKIGTVTNKKTGEGIAFGGSGNFHGRSLYYEAETTWMAQGKRTVAQINNAFGAIFNNDSQSGPLGTVEPLNEYDAFLYDFLKRAF